MQFAQIAGQIQLINSLIDTVKEGRVPHARLFSGSEGYGGFALALAYAQFISCSNRQYFDTSNDNALHGDSCGKCPSCIKYANLAHPDLHFVFPNTATKTVDKNNESALFMEQFREFVLEKEAYIDTNSWFDYLKVDNKQGEINVRDANTIIKNLTMTAYESPYKIMIIWNAERLRHDAAPKLLKIIEEPYEGTIFLLVAENTEAILPTILSRCQLVKVLPIEDKAIEDYMTARMGIAPETAANIAANSEGDLIKALQYDNQSSKEFTETFIQWTRLAFQYRTKASDILSLSESLSKMGREPQKNFLAFCQELFRECLFEHLGIAKSEGYFKGEDLVFRKKFSTFVTPENINQIYKLLEQARYHIVRNANPKILFFDLTLQLGKQLAPNK